MADFLTTVDSDRGPLEPIPVTLVSAGLEVSIASGLPTSTAAASITPVTIVDATGLLVKAAPGNLYGASMTAGAAAGFFLAYNATAIPAPGATLTQTLILYDQPVAANGYASIGDAAMPDRFGVGIVLLFSTTKATYTAPASPALHIRGKAA